MILGRGLIERGFDDELLNLAPLALNFRSLFLFKCLVKLKFLLRPGAVSHAIIGDTEAIMGLIQLRIRLDGLRIKIDRGFVIAAGRIEVSELQ